MDAATTVRDGNIPFGSAHLRGEAPDLWDRFFLPLNAPLISETYYSLHDAQPRITYETGRMLHGRWPAAQRQPLASATGDMAEWLAANGAETSIVVTIAYEYPRAVVIFHDRGRTTPDVNASHADLIRMARILNHGVKRWSCHIPGKYRVTHLYYDPTPEEPSTQEQPQ